MPADHLASLKGSFSAYLGRITRQVTRFDKIKSLPPTPTSLAEVKKYREDAAVAFSKLEDIFFDIVDSDPTLLEDYEQRVLNASDKYDALAQAVGDFLHSATATPAAPVANPPPVAAPQNIKVVHDLRPSKLSLDNTPSEFHLWTEAFKAYYSASHMERLSLGDQHAFLFQCLDADLHKRVRPDVRADTTVFHDDNDGEATSVLGLLEAIFMHRYPLVQRRFEFFQYPHSAGQLASAWIAELRMRGDIADLNDLTVDELFAFRIITGVQDPDLQDELLKLKSPSLKDVESATLLYEAKLSTKAKTSVNRVQSRPVSQRNSRNSRSSRCTRCNRTNHATQSCMLPSMINCHQCGRRGHIAPACRNVAARIVTEEPIIEEGDVSVRVVDTPRTEDTSETPVAICTLANPNRPTPRIELKFRQHGVHFTFLALPDTGATRSVVAYDLVQRYQLSLEKCQQVILIANGDRIQCAGRVVLSVSFGDLETTVDALVTPDLKSDILLSWHDLQRLEILSEHFPLPIVRALSPMSTTLNKLFEFYSDVLSDTLGTRKLSGPPMKIHLRKDMPIKPFKIYTTKQIPLHLQSEADASIQRALDDGVICRETSPTDWCCRGGFVPKPNGKLRLITDFIPLNKFVLRPVHPFPSALDIVQSISSTSKVFAVLDCTMGYFQVPLDEDSSKLTTFLLPQGRFRYKRAPMGLSASSDEFCRRSDDALAGLDGVQKLVDDILIQAPNTQVLFQRLERLLSRCREHGLTLSKRKAQFALAPTDTPVKFAGFLISARGIQPDPDKISSLEMFPVPQNITQLRSFLGLANQLAFFIPDLAHLTARMRLLLKKGIAYTWDSDMEADFCKIKSVLTSKLVVRPFDPSLKTQLLTDASRIGLGYALMQIGTDGNPRLVHCGSRALIPAETRYAIIELECLAVIYAMNKCDYYLRGMSSFSLVTDHRPLVRLFEKSLTEVDNPRIQRFREKIASYTFEVRWIPGKANNIADALSRAPHFMPDAVDYASVRPIVTGEVGLHLDSMEQAVCQDVEYQKVVDALLQGGRLDRLPAVHPAHHYSSIWTRLSVTRGILVLDGMRLIPPLSQRQEILHKLHAPHQGLVRTRKQAQQLYYWPGINNQIKMMVESCSACQKFQPSQNPRPQVHTKAEFAMEKVSVDLFEYAGSHYVLMVDRFSGYLWVDKLRGLCTVSVTKVLHNWFLAYGFPLFLRSDGGPQFRSEFDKYCHKYGIKHDLSSPHHPESNGHAESNIKTIKHLLIKCLETKEDFRYALMELQNTPRGDGFSPAQLYFGRRQRTLLPCVPQHLSLKVDVDAGSRARERMYILKQGEARTQGKIRVLSKLSPGQNVLMQDIRSKRWIFRGRVLSCSGTGKSYWIRLDNGKVSWRNRKYLRPISSPLILSGATELSGAPKSASQFTGPHPGTPVRDERRLRSTAPINYREARSYTRKS